MDRAIETVAPLRREADRLEGQTLPFGDTPRGENRIGWYTREPVGVVAAITPFNDPLNLVAHKVAPALIGGNGVVLKPAEQTPLVALAFIELLLDAGVPADRVAVLPGRGAAVGALWWATRRSTSCRSPVASPPATRSQPLPARRRP